MALESLRMNPGASAVEKTLAVATILCVSTAYLSFAGQVSGGYAIAFVLLALLGAATDAFEIARGTALPRPPRFALNLLSVGILAVSVSRMEFDNIVEVFTEAILLMIAVKMLERKLARDYIQIAGMSLLTVLSSAVSNTDDLFIYYCFLISFLSGLLLLLSSFVIPSARGGRTVLPVWGFRPLGRWAFLIWLGMLPVCLLLFFSAPRARDTVLSFRGNDDRANIGFSEQISLGSVRRIQESGEIAFRAETTEEVPQSLMYWRGLVLDHFDGQTWSASPGGGRGPDRGTTMPGQGLSIEQEIVLEPGSHRRLFALDKPVAVTGEGVAPAGDAEYVRWGRGARRFSYKAVSTLSPILRTSGPIRPERFLRLPEAFIPRLRQVVAELTDGASDAEKMEILRRYFDPPAFSYSLDDLPVSQNALESFIFSRRRGNCEYFASALAVMLRMADVPARLVAGYHGGIYNESGGYYIVAQSAAHVWVEAWDAEASLWRRLDPTPSASSLDAAGAAREFGVLQLYFDLFNYRLSSLFLQYGRESQFELLQRIREIFSSSASPVPSIRQWAEALGAGGAFAHWLRYLLLALAALLAAAAIFLARRRPRVSPDERLLRRFLRAMEGLGYPKKRGEGLEEFVKRAGRAGDAARHSAALDAAALFVDTFQRYYFKDLSVEPAERAVLEEKIEVIRRSGR